MGGPEFMGVLTLLLIITTAWFVYHLVLGFNSKQVNQEKLLKKIEYGKSIGLFALIVGIFGQLVGLSAMFSVIAEVDVVIPKLVYGGIKVTMICTFYGIFIYLFSLVLWFVATTIIEKKLDN